MGAMGTALRLVAGVGGIAEMGGALTQGPRSLEAACVREVPALVVALYSVACREAGTAPQM